MPDLGPLERVAFFVFMASRSVGRAAGAGGSGPMSQRLLAGIERLARNFSLLVSVALRLRLRAPRLTVVKQVLARGGALLPARCSAFAPGPSPSRTRPPYALQLLAVQFVDKFLISRPHAYA